MAIEIIKNTMVDPIEMTCECCKSVFTYNYKDIQRREEHMFLGLGSTVRRYITCPVCKYDNDVDRVIVELQKNKEAEPEEKSEEEDKKEEVYCTECPYFEEVVGKSGDWFGASCTKDGHESSPSMYAIQSLHNDCPLEKEKEKEETNE